MRRDTGISRGWRHLALLLASAAPLAAQQPTFAELHRMLPLKQTDSHSLAVADLNSDGHQDLFIAGAYQDWLYVNDGTAHFTDVTSSLPVQAQDTRSVAAGDVDGDGDADFLLALGSGYAPLLLLNDGAATFTMTVGHVPPTSIDFVTFGDVDGDGDLDAVGCKATGPSVFLYLNNGAGFFTDATGTHLPSSLPAGGKVIALGDVDGDGDLDAFWGRIGLNRLLLNTGIGSFLDATSQLPAIADATFDVALADLDGDGDLDAVVVNKSAQSPLPVPSYLLLNDGAGAFAGPVFFPGVLQHAIAVATFDIDLDSDVDVLIAGSGAQVYLNGPGPVAPIALDSVGGGCLAEADFDADGDRDVVIGDQLYLNAQGAGLAQVRPMNGPFSGSVVSLATGDVDGDGDRDVLTNGGTTPRLYHNDGAGVLTDVTAQTVFSSTSSLFSQSHVTLADLDGDGDLDCFAGTLYLNNGIGAFIDATVLLPPNTPEIKAIADVDGDGDLDAYDGQPNLLLNDGAAGFSYAATFLPPVLYDNYSPAAFGDFDGDGDQDLLILASAWGNSPMRLFLNAGSGVFIDGSANLPYTWDLSAAVALGDVDGDGDLDALMTDLLYAPAALLVNNGSGVFTALPTPITGGYGVAFGDVDQDGDLDVVSGWFAELWLNDGTGAFSNGSHLLPPQRPVLTDPAVEDFDGDGDVDILIGTTDPSGCQLLSNLTRQLSWRAPPRVGKPLMVDIVGPPNGAYLLIANTVTSIIPVQPFGILRLDPTTSAIVGSGALDQQGRAALSFAVPLTAPIGFAIYAQAAIGWPIHVTNPEVFVVTGL